MCTCKNMWQSEHVHPTDAENEVISFLCLGLKSKATNGDELDWDQIKIV